MLTKRVEFVRVLIYMVCYMQNNSVLKKILNNRYDLEDLSYHTQVVTITVFWFTV
jgi:hypothetical protein